MSKEVTITIALPSDADIASRDGAVGNSGDAPPVPLSLEELGRPENASESSETSSDDTPSPLPLDQLRLASSQEESAAPMPLSLDELRKPETSTSTSSTPVSEELPEAQTTDLPSGPDARHQSDVTASMHGYDAASAAADAPGRPELPADPPRRTKEYGGQ